MAIHPSREKRISKKAADILCQCLMVGMLIILVVAAAAPWFES